MQGWLAAAERAGSDDPQVTAKVKAGLAFLRHCKPDGAAMMFRQANALTSGGCGGCLLAAAFAMSQNGQLDAAVDDAHAAIDRLGGDPLLAEAYGQLSRYLLMEDTTAALAEAESSLETAAEADGSYQATALSRLAGVRLLRGHYSAAIEAARRAIAADPSGKAGLAARSALCRARRAGYADDEPANAAARHLEVADAPVRLAPGMKPPVPIYTPAPVYTEPARKARLAGTVEMEVTVDEHGCVAEEKVLQGLPLGLDQAAVETVQGWVFEPTTRDGKPLRVILNLSLEMKPFE